MTGTVTTDTSLELRLAGSWTGRVLVTIDGLLTKAKRLDGAWVITVPPGTSTITIT